MCAQSVPQRVGRPDVDAAAPSGLYDVLRVGSKMLEQPTARRTLRLASAAARAIAGCVIPAVYLVEGNGLARYSGRANRRLDRQVEARAGVSGVIESERGWRYALFFRAASTVKGAFVLQTKVEPSRQELFLLSALGEPTGSALATAELLERERREAQEVLRLAEVQDDVNRTLTATVRRLDSHEQIRASLILAAGAGSDTGEGQIVEALSAIIHRSVVLRDSFGNDRAFVGVDGQTSPSPRAMHADTASDGVPARAWRATEIRSGADVVGMIGVYGGDGDRVDDDHLFAVELAQEMIAVELVHHRRIADVGIRLRRDLANDLVKGVPTDDAFARAEALEFDLSGPQRAVLISWEHPVPNTVDMSAAVRRELAAMHVPALISHQADSAVLAIVAESADLSRLYERLSSTVSNARGTIGVSARCVTADLPRSFAEANQALRIKMESHRPYGLSNYDDLGLLRILDMSNDGLELATYLDEWLGALIEHDREHHSELVHTLTLYLDSGGNYDRTADALAIHRSTLRYRLTRIREVSGRDLTDPDARLNLHVAVTAHVALHDGPR